MQKHAVTIKGHRTSISLEAEFWMEIKAIAERQHKPLAALIAEIDALRGQEQGLSSAIRIYVLQSLQALSNSG